MRIFVVWLKPSLVWRGASKRMKLWTEKVFRTSTFFTLKGKLSALSDFSKYFKFPTTRHCQRGRERERSYRVDQRGREWKNLKMMKSSIYTDLWFSLFCTRETFACVFFDFFPLSGVHPTPHSHPRCRLLTNLPALNLKWTRKNSGRLTLHTPKHTKLMFIFSVVFAPSSLSLSFMLLHPIVENELNGKVFFSANWKIFTRFSRIVPRTPSILQDVEMCSHTTRRTVLWGLWSGRNFNVIRYAHSQAWNQSSIWISATSLRLQPAFLLDTWTRSSFHILRRETQNNQTEKVKSQKFSSRML